MAAEQKKLGGRELGLFQRAQMHIWRQIKSFAAVDTSATYLWPRWIVLRCVGIVYVVIFLGVIVEGQALIGPKGIAPLASFFDVVEKVSANPVEMLLRAPSVFWFGTGTGMIATFQWLGLAAAVGVVLNLWPRMSLFACWLILLSFVSSWQVFSSTVIDEVMIETALVCIAFAPAGLRPGLGRRSPPRTIAVFAMRWLLFRIMFESGLVKLVEGDTHWRHFTAMEVMYETCPFPTILGYFAYSLPHAYHVVEVALTFLAELGAPLLALFGGRRGRWLALAIWVGFQGGIELTSNFGWLNTGSLVLGFVLLDDQMLVSAAIFLRLRRIAATLAASVKEQAAPVIGAFRLYGLRVLLGAHFCLTLYYAVIFFGGWSLKDIPYMSNRPVELIFGGFKSTNVYHPYASFPATKKYEVEFEGSNDGGSTWRTYPFRHKPQREDELSGFIAPWFARFEATLQIATYTNPRSRLMPKVAAKLIERNPDVMSLFKDDPFPDKPPTMIRMPVYLMRYTDPATHRKTGLYWTKTRVGEFLPMVYVNDEGRATEAKQ
jgi:lipase maturation factor 1